MLLEARLMIEPNSKAEMKDAKTFIYFRTSAELVDSYLWVYHEE